MKYLKELLTLGLFLIFTFAFNLLFGALLVPYDGMTPEMRPQNTLYASINDFFETGAGSIILIILALSLAAALAYQCRKWLAAK